MAKAFRQIEEKSIIADLFIIVLDARAPISTYNEDFDKISPNKPRLFVISKPDLADTSKVKNLIQKFNHKADKAIIVDLKKPKAHKIILKQAEILLEPKRQKDLKKGIIKPRLRAIVIGVPNSGKSTLINSIAKKQATKVGNRPGVTRGQQWVNTGDIQLLDTPGILWPKFEDELVGVKLAVIGSIKIEVIPKQEIFYAGYKLISKYYPEKIKLLNLKPSQNEKEIYSNLIKLCEQKNFLMKGQKPDITKGMTFFTNYLRDLKGVTYD